MTSRPSLLRRLYLLPVFGYQKIISPWMPNVCRFQPTCSRYFVAAVEQWGIGRGTWRGLRRFARCHPWHPGGYDPVE